MKTRLFLSFLLNLIFAWSLCILGWQSVDFYAFVLVIPLVLSVAFTLSAGHWLLWKHNSYNKNRITLNACFSIVFAWISYYGAWFDSRSLMSFENLLSLVLLLAIVAVFTHWAIGNLQIRQRDNLEKRKRDKLDTVLRDLSQEDVLQLRRRLLENDKALEHMVISEESEILRERH